MNPTPAQPTPDPVQEPATTGATGGASITGEVHEPGEHDDDSANGSGSLEQRVAPNPFRDRDPSNHGTG